MSESIQPKVITTNGIKSQSVRFRSLLLKQNPDGTYSARLQYVLITTLDGEQIRVEELAEVQITHAQLLGSAEGVAAFPLIQAFCRAQQAAATPELFVTA